MATNSFPVGEMLHMRRPNAKTWMNFDGTYTTEVYQGAVHYEDENSNLHNINTDLFDEADFDIIDEAVSKEVKNSFKKAKETAKAAKNRRILNREDYGYQGLKLPFDVKIPRNFKKGYSIGKGQDKITFIPLQASPSVGELSATDRSIIHYQDVWNDTDVELKVIPEGIKETLILKTEKAPSNFSFEIKGKDVDDDFNAGQLQIQPAWLMDAAGTYRDVEMAIDRKNDNKLMVHLIADVTDLVYPIEIDPTVIVSTEVVSSTDAWVYEQTPTTKYANLDYFAVGVQNYVGYTYRSYLKFDTPNLPQGTRIVSAALTVTAYQSYSSGLGNSNFHIHRVTGNWDPANLFWNNQPSFEPIPDAGVYVPPGIAIGEKINVEATKTIQEWISGKTNNGVLLKYQNENQYGYPALRFFKSSRNPTIADRPKLSVNYYLPPTNPTLLQPNGGENINSLHLIKWTPSASQSNEKVVNFFRTGSESTTVQGTATRMFAQIFTAQADWIKKIEMTETYSNSVSNSKFEIAIYSVDNDRPTVPISGWVPFVKAGSTLSFNFNTFVERGKKYAFVIRNSAGTQFSYIDGTGNKTYDSNGGGTLVYSTTDTSGVTTWNNESNNTVRATFTYLEGGFNLQYQVQLTRDNGGSWKDLFMTANTEMNYDFINEPESFVSKIRVRAYDGSAYSEWDESDGVFTIQHNQAPSTPLNLAPNGGNAVDRAKPIRFSWLHNDPNAGDPQSKYDLQWRLSGTTSWNTVSNASTNQFVDLTNLPHGSIEWRVRTYDQAGLSSAYSDIALFIAGDKPAKAIITSPANGATVAIANPAIQWSSVDQVAYKLVVKNASGTAVWTKEENSLNKAVTANANLANQQTYTVELSIKNQDGLWSDPAAITLNISYTPPAMPGLSASGFDYDGKIKLSLNAPQPTGTQPSVTHHEIYRRKQMEKAWKRIELAAPANGSFEDLTPGSGQRYDYFIRAWGDNGTYRDSGIVSGSIQLSSIWLLDPLDPESLHDFHYFEPGRTAERTFSGQLMEFEGRTQFMAEFSRRETNKVNVVLQLKKESDDLAALHDLLSRRTTLLYRDAKGRRLFGAIFVLSENETDYGYTVPVEVQAVSYEEEV